MRALQFDAYSVQPLEPRRLLAATASKITPAVLTDDDGSQIEIVLSGPGRAVADIVNGQLELTTRGTSQLTQLQINITGGDGIATASQMALGKIGDVLAPRIALHGNLTGQWVKSLSLYNISDSSIQITTLGRFYIKSMTSSSLRADRINSISASGNIISSTISAIPKNDTLPAIQSIAIRGTLDRSNIFALGDIVSVQAAAMLGSNVTAGVRVSETSTQDHIVHPLPSEYADFTGTYRIEKVVVGGIKNKAYAFCNTIIGAYEIYNVTLNQVDGRKTTRPEFGVAAYKVGRVTRRFDAANVWKNGAWVPDADFKVRQISQPIFFDPATLTYSGVLPPQYGSSGSIIRANPGGVGNVILTPQLPIPIDGLAVGAFTGTPAGDVYLAQNGQYELRDSFGGVVISFPSLSGLVTGLFSNENTSIKIETNTSNGATTFRCTSVGPVLSLFSILLGTTQLSAFDSQGQATEDVEISTDVSYRRDLISGTWTTYTSYTLTPSNATFQTRALPSIASLSEQVSLAGIPTLVFNKQLLLVKVQSFSLGKIVSILGEDDISLSTTLDFVSDGDPMIDLAHAIKIKSAAPIGSRRLPPRFKKLGDDSVMIYGLANGGTAFVEGLGHSALNMTGDLQAVPTDTELRNALVAIGFTFAYGT